MATTIQNTTQELRQMLTNHNELKEIKDTHEQIEIRNPIEDMLNMREEVLSDNEGYQSDRSISESEGLSSENMRLRQKIVQEEAIARKLQEELERIQKVNLELQSRNDQVTTSEQQLRTRIEAANRQFTENNRLLEEVRKNKQNQLVEIHALTSEMGQTETLRNKTRTEYQGNMKTFQESEAFYSKGVSECTAQLTQLNSEIAAKQAAQIHPMGKSYKEIFQKRSISEVLQWKYKSRVSKAHQDQKEISGKKSDYLAKRLGR